MSQTYTVDLESVRIHYAEAGDAAPALVIVHGATGSYASFLPLLPALAQHAHVYAIDLRGHNLSGRTPGAYQVPDYGRDVAAFLRTVVGKPAVVAGHSLGGLVTAWLAASAPDLVQGIVLEDPPFYITQPPRLETTPFYGFFLFLRDALRQHHARGGTLEEMVAFVGQLPVNDKQTMLEAAGAEMVRLRAIELQRLDPEILDPAIDGVILGEHEPDGLLAQIRCPIHLLAADADFGGAMDAQDVQHFITSAPHCSYAVLKGTGHGIHEERPGDYLQAVQHFMAEIVR
jgi:pimeloyl-ACP methyl ester carboxylesterase